MKLSMILSATDKMSRVIDQASRNVKTKFAGIEKATKSLNSISDKMFITGGIMAAGIYKTVKAAEDGATADARLKNAFTSMWGNSGAVVSAAQKQIDFSEKLALQIGVDEDIIKLTQAKLTTFTNLSNKTAVMSGIFERATRASQDMAAMGFGEASQNAVILGKALQDPMRMATALKKQGTLTASDIVSVQNVMKTKGLLEAQKYILTAVERQVKGTAAATANGTDIMKVAFGQITEEIGKSFLPMVEVMKNSIVSNIEPTKKWITENKSLIVNVLKIGTALLAVAAVIKVFVFATNMVMGAIKVYKAISSVIKLVTTAQWALNAAFLANPVTWVVVGITALVAIIAVAWKKFAGFRAIVKTSWEVIKEFGAILKDYVIDRIKGVISGLGSIGKAIALLFKGKFSEAGKVAVSGIKDLYGVSALQNAVTHTVQLGKETGSTYNRIYAEEKAAQEPRSKQAIRSANAFNTKNVRTANLKSAQTIHYSPNITINGNANKEDFKKMLNDHASEINKITKKNNQNNMRLAY